MACMGMSLDVFTKKRSVSNYFAKWISFKLKMCHTNTLDDYVQIAKPDVNNANGEYLNVFIKQNLRTPKGIFYSTTAYRKRRHF